MERMMSLVWFPVFPAHFGGQKGIAEFYKALSHYFSIDCFCAAANAPLHEGKLQVIPKLPNGKKQFFNPFVWRKILRQYQQEQYRFVLIEFPYYGLMGYLLKKKGAMYLLHTHNIESERFRQLGKWWWLLLQLYEKWSMHKADLVLFKTAADKDFAVQNFSVAENKTYVLPYGIKPEPTTDRTACRRFLEETYSIAPDEKILLFAGTLDYLPNAEAVTAIYHHIAPLLFRQNKPYRIIICGRNKEAAFSYLKEYCHEKIIQAGFVQDMSAYFGGADVFINPVQRLFGVQTKIFDALAMHLNVVAFDEAGAGLPLYLFERKLFLARNKGYDEFVNRIEQAAWENEQTPERFFEEFHWPRIASNFAGRLKSIRS